MVSTNDKRTAKFFIGSNGVAQGVNIVDMYCLSTDEKPTENIANGSSLLEMDTSKAYFFDEENQRWLEFGGGA